MVGQGRFLEENAVSSVFSFPSHMKSRQHRQRKPPAAREVQTEQEVQPLDSIPDRNLCKGIGSCRIMQEEAGVGYEEIEKK